MTIVNRFGIVHGTDSNVRHDNAEGVQVDLATKAFSLGDSAAITVAGNWHIANDFMDNWMNEFISAELAREDFSLRLFANHLAVAWHQEIPASRREPLGNWAHIAGYERIKNESHPEFWAVTNIRDQNVEGPTDIDTTRFHHWEDLSTRDCRVLRGTDCTYDLFAEFADRSIITVPYQNGHGDGRMLINVMAYLCSVQHLLGVLMEDFLSRSPDTEIAINAFRDLERSVRLEQLVAQISEVRNPNDLQSSGELVKRTIELIGAAFEARNDDTVGGEPQVIPIKRPDDMCTGNRRCPMYPPKVIDGDLPPEFDVEP